MRSTNLIRVTVRPPHDDDGLYSETIEKIAATKNWLAYAAFKNPDKPSLTLDSKNKWDAPTVKIGDETFDFYSKPDDADQMFTDVFPDQLQYAITSYPAWYR